MPVFFAKGFKMTYVCHIRKILEKKNDQMSKDPYFSAKTDRHLCFYWHIFIDRLFWLMIMNMCYGVLQHVLCVLIDTLGVNWVWGPAVWATSTMRAPRRAQGSMGKKQRDGWSRDNSRMMVLGPTLPPDGAEELEIRDAIKHPPPPVLFVFLPTFLSISEWAYSGGSADTSSRNTSGRQAPGAHILTGLGESWPPRAPLPCFGWVPQNLCVLPRSTYRPFFPEVFLDYVIVNKKINIRVVGPRRLPHEPAEGNCEAMGIDGGPDSHRILCVCVCVSMCRRWL